MTSCAKDSERHSLVQTSFAELPNTSGSCDLLRLLVRNITKGHSLVQTSFTELPGRYKSEDARDLPCKLIGLDHLVVVAFLQLGLVGIKEVLRNSELRHVIHYEF